MCRVAQSAEGSVGVECDPWAFTKLPLRARRAVVSVTSIVNCGNLRSWLTRAKLIHENIAENKSII
jgi:hypothetical protein